MLRAVQHRRIDEQEKERADAGAVPASARYSLSDLEAEPNPQTRRKGQHGHLRKQVIGSVQAQTLHMRHRGIVKFSTA